MTNIDNNLLLTEPFNIDSKGVSILAFGAELKSSICLINDGKIFVSKTLDNLTDADNYRKFIEMAKIFRSALGRKPDLIAYDMHPGYAASNYAKELGLPGMAIQHHFAHIVAAMVDNDLDEPVIGIAADGTGYGDDGAIWGCEILKCDRKSYIRAGHLKYFKLFGGDTASIETWRPAVGLMCETFGADWDFDRVDENALAIAKKRIAQSELVKTSSLGRLFDAVAFLLNICNENEFEAQAPIALEQAASQSDSQDRFDYELTKDEQGCIELDFRQMVAAITADVKTGKDVNMIKAGIIDPVLVTKSALKNAVSVVTTIISADCVISNKRMA